MAIQAKKQSSWLVILIIVVAVVLWALDQRKQQTGKETTSDRPVTVPSAPAPPRNPPPAPGKEKGSSEAPHSSTAKQREGRYEIYRNCTLAADKTNDGDSFRVQLPDGRREIFRLYFVDTPESDFKSYRNGDNNHERIRDQANYFGISPEQAVGIGQEGKHYVLGLLGKQPFTVYTEWDSPFHDERYHAFIQVNGNGKPRWLHELLVEKGLVRIKTKPADLPDGTKAGSHRRLLEDLQAAARKSRTGGWKTPQPAGIR